MLYRWVEPKICVENVTGAVQLPTAVQREPCPPCNPGYYNSNSNDCLPCPPGTYSDGTYGNAARPAGTVPEAAPPRKPFNQCLSKESQLAFPLPKR